MEDREYELCRTAQRTQSMHILKAIWLALCENDRCSV